MIVCRECGHHNPNDATFCENAECGRFLEWSGEAVDTAILPRIDADSPSPRCRGHPAPSTPLVRFVAALTGQDPDAALAIDISPAEVEVPPGEETVAEVGVRARRPHRTLARGSPSSAASSGT